MSMKVDVFILTYNRANYLFQSIQSVLKQTYTDFNLFILDNCSTDETESVVRNFKDDRIRYIRHKKNLGVIGNMNYAYKNATSEYFMILHDDDTAESTLLEKEVMVLENHKEFEIVSCKTNTMNEAGDITKCNIENKGDIRTYSGGEYFCTYLKEQLYIAHMTILYRTKFIQSNNIFLDENAGASADAVLWFEIERKGGTIAIINECLLNYRVYKEQQHKINHVSMMGDLFCYLKRDRYYSSILNNHKKEQCIFYRKLLFNELCLAASGEISCNEAKLTNSNLKKGLVGRWRDKMVFEFIIGCIHLAPFFMKKAYYFGKYIKAAKNQSCIEYRN